MKKISLLLLVILLFVGVQTKAQEVQKQRRISLKLYSQIMAEKLGNTQGISLSFNPAVSLSTKKGRFHELELSQMSYKTNTVSTFRESLNSPTNSYKENEFLMGLRYSFNFSLVKNKKIEVYIGTGLNGYYQMNDLKAISSLVFPQTNYNYGVDFNLTPRVIWGVSDKMFLDINIPVNVLNINYNTRHYINPLIPEGYNNQTITTNSTFPNKYTINVGLGFKF